jgi:hypothetical protein
MAVDLWEEKGSESGVKVLEGNDTSSTSYRLVNYRQWTLALEPIPEEF